jgi:two-component system LytT family response regulator
VKIKTLIVDDEVLARKRIKRLLAGESDIAVIGECANGRTAIDFIIRETPDLLFLDVQMPELDGFSVLSTVGTDKIASVIFVTAYDHYALRAFEMHALDYLLKPFDRKRFEHALRRARTQIRYSHSQELNEKLSALLQSVESEPTPLDRLVIKTNDRVLLLRTDEIDWIEAADNYVRLHVGAKKYLYRETMKSLEAQLNSDTFWRIHRSVIINSDRVKELQPWFNGDFIVILRDETRLTLSRSYREKLNLRLRKPL